MPGGNTVAGGRPTKYKAEYCKIVKKLCELGATVPELAEALGVAESTVKLWAVQHAPFSAALSLGRKVADDRVERSLYERAVGYTHDEVDIRTVALGNNQGSEIVETPIRKHYPPDTKAALAWLYNRRSKHWHPLGQQGDGGEGAQASKVVIEVVDARRDGGS
jgi:hypothetical protein